MKKLRAIRYMLQVTRYKLKVQRGFSLMEMLVVVAIIALFTSMLLTYTKTGSKQIILFREQAKFIEELAQARSSAVSRIQTAGEKVCGYGISFTGPSTYVLYRADPDLNNACGVSSFIYTGTAEDVEKFSFDPLIRVSNSVRDILFVPPEPRVAFDGSITLGGEAQIELAIPGSNKVVITINSGGQIVSQ